MYAAISDVLNEVAVDDSIKVLLLTGEGEFYSSGNDLSNFTNIPPEGPKALALDGRKRLQ